MGGAEDVMGQTRSDRLGNREPAPLGVLVGGRGPIAEKVRALVRRCDSASFLPSDLDWRKSEVDELIRCFSAPRAAPMPRRPSRDADRQSAGAQEGQASRSDLVSHHAMAEESVWAIVGDLHGDYPALEHILCALFDGSMGDEDASRIHIAFLGDLLDRGAKDFQVLHLVLCLRRLLGERLLLLRGNHEELCLDDEGLLLTKVAESRGTHGRFAVKYRDVIEPELSRRLVSFFDALPHLAVLESPRGRICLVHGGIPPAFIFNRFNSLEELMGMENARRAFLWGRPYPSVPTVVQPRPDRFYDFRRFYREDADDFREKFKVAVLMRGHDAAEPGYESRWGGTMLTVFSSGAGPSREAAEVGAYADNVYLPRYLLVETDRLFRGFEAPPGRPDIDAGIGVREVYRSDVVILLSGPVHAGDASLGALFQAAREIQAQLRPAYDVPIHLLDRRGYTDDGDAELDVLEPSGSAYDDVLDLVRCGRRVYVLETLPGPRLIFFRWHPSRTASEAISLPESVTFDHDSILSDGIAACAALIAEDLS